jgi:uncharacterized membrane protein YhaH (DUF805 family)
MEWYIKVLENYAVFEGRARRMEYWMFVLVNLFISIGIGLVQGLLGLGEIIGSLYGLAIFIPALAVTMRRLHDSGRSGWWVLLYLIPILGTLVLLLFMCFEGDHGSNDYGPDPISR